MEFSKLSAPTLKELFVEQLENLILSGKLSIGEKLPSERELADSMQVSRSVVNAGLAEIADKGFLEIVPRSGTYVADYRKKGKLDTIISIMKFNGGTLPDPDILSILQIRKVLTALALELAIPRITDEEIQQLFTCSAQFDKTNDCVICQPSGELGEEESALAQCFMAIAGFVRKMSGTSDVDADTILHISTKRKKKPSTSRRLIS